MSCNTIRVGLIGAGFIGRIHAEVLNSLDGIEITAVLEDSTVNVLFPHMQEPGQLKSLSAA